jgi:hypothetical protein
VSSSLSSSIIKHNFTGVVSLVADSQSSAYALCGLLAFGTFQTHGDSLADWHSLFALEGSLAVYMVIVAFIFLPYSAGHAKFLTEDEKELALYRMQVDSSSVVNEPSVFRDAIAILKEPTNWVILTIEVCLGVPLQSIALFLPQTIARLSYATVKTNLHTAAPNITGAVMLLILGFASEYTRWCFPFVALGFFFTFVNSWSTPQSTSRSLCKWRTLPALS